MEFFADATGSPGGRNIFALPSRNLKGESNILVALDDLPNRFTNREALDMIITEYGVAAMIGRTIRERAQALIDIAHPDDRQDLVRQAKEAHILYQDQIYLAESAALYPDALACTHVFKNNLRIHFRAIKPSDEEGMRHLFHRFSDKAVYYRYFSETKAMPHIRLQEYVNVDYRNILSMVGLIEEEGLARIIAEGRYVTGHNRSFADVAFVVDESFQGQGVASFLLELLLNAARERGIAGFSADIPADNLSIIKVFEKSRLHVQAFMEHGLYHLTIPFAGSPAP
jgi:GNAT superfamily N-acetyltransferase